MKFAFFSTQKLDTLKADIAQAQASEDGGERLLAYAKIYMTAKDGKYEQFMTPAGKWLSRGVMLGGVAALVGGVLLGSVLTGGAIAIAALGTVQTLVHAPQTSRYAAIMADLKDTIAEEEYNASLESIGASPKLDAVMLAFPRLRPKFQQAIDSKAVPAQLTIHSVVLKLPRAGQ